MNYVSHNKVKIGKWIFFKNFFIIFFYNSFFIYMKMSKNLSAEYYQWNKERPQKKGSWKISKFF